MKNYKAWLK